MGVLRGGKQATAEYLRNMDRLIESQPHSIYVIQDKRALHDYARELGVELSVGDPDDIRGGRAKKEGFTEKDADPKELARGIKEEMEHSDDRALAKKTALDHLAEDPHYYSKLKKVMKKSGPDLFVELEKSGKFEIANQEPHFEFDIPHEDKDEKGDEPAPKEEIPETPPGAGSTSGAGKPPTPAGGGEGQKQDMDGNRYPHKYIKKFRSPKGNWIYVYHEEGAKRTGFGGEPEVMPKAPAIGQKREQVAANIKERARMKGGKAREQAFDFHQWARNSMNVPEQTPKAIKGAVDYLGGGAQGMNELKRRHDDWMARNPHITDPQDKAFAGEMLAREVVGAHQSGEIGKEGDADQQSRYAKRPGGFTPSDPAMRQPWQLTREEFGQRQKLDPKLKNTNYEHVLAQAARRQEYIPTHVLGQGDEKDHEFTKRMHDFKEKYLKEQKPEIEMSPETQEYVQKFDKLVEGLPKKFDGWVKPDVKREGDKYLSVEKASGYNIDSYDVTDAGVYSHMMTAPETLVLYHQYAEHADHGRELLAQLHEHGIDCEYTVIKRGSAVAWDNDWADEPEMAYRETGETDEKGRPKRIGYSSDYVLAFKPKDDKQAENIAALLHEHAHAGSEKMGAQPHQAIHRSWYVPDVRSSKKIGDYKRAFLNIKTMGHQELCILTKNDFIKAGTYSAPESAEEARSGPGSEEDYDESFSREYVYVDQALHDVIKALLGYGRLGRGEVVIVNF